MDRPPVNAIDLEVLHEVRETLTALSDDQGVGALVMTGAGRCFCAGVDLKVVPAYDSGRQQEYVRLVNEVITGAFAFAKPTVAAVNGPATAGGFILMLCCDYRLGAEGDYPLGVTEARVGIPFPVSTLEVLRHELSPPVFRRLLLTGANHPPERALEWGILDELRCPSELLPRAVEAAAGLAGLPREGYGRIKRQVRGGSVEFIERVVAEGEPMLDSWITEEGRAGAAGLLDSV